jgi:DNA modification methylase
MSAGAPWANRITRHAEVDPSTLAANPANWRRHPKSQADALAGVLSEVGYVQSVIVNERSGRIVDGHLRVELAVARGEPTIPVVFVDLADDEERLILATLDPLAALAETDAAALAALLAEVTAHDDDVRRLVQFIASDNGLGARPVREDPGPQLDRAEELREKWGTDRGQLWRVGRHRLLCGDATSAEDVSRLMDGRSARLVVTSPPYNQGIDTFTPSGMHTESDWVPKVQRLAYPDSLPEAEYQAQQSTLLATIHTVMDDRASWFYNHKNRSRGKRVLSPLEWLPGPFRLRQEIIWSRPGSVTQNARMFMPSDERIFWLYKGADFYFDDATDGKSWSTVWPIAVGTKKDHAAGFPLEIPLRCVRACSQIGEAVLDPCAGSGTTVVAAEQMDRDGYGLDIDPVCIAVSLERLAGMGLDAERLD